MASPAVITVDENIKKQTDVLKGLERMSSQDNLGNPEAATALREKLAEQRRSLGKLHQDRAALVCKEAQKSGREPVTAVALYDHKASAADHLEFKTGDAVVVAEQAGDGWWTGSIGDRCGIFPGTYVQIKPSTAAAAKPAEEAPEVKSKRTRLSKAIGHLKVHIAQLTRTMERPEVKADSRRTESLSRERAQSENNLRNMSSELEKVPSSPVQEPVAVNPNELGEEALVLYTYAPAAGMPNTLAVTKGERVSVMHKTDETWWHVVNLQQLSGYVPSSYLQLVPVLEDADNSGFYDESDNPMNVSSGPEDNLRKQRGLTLIDVDELSKAVAISVEQQRTVSGNESGNEDGDGDRRTPPLSSTRTANTLSARQDDVDEIGSTSTADLHTGPSPEPTTTAAPAAAVATPVAVRAEPVQVDTREASSPAASKVPPPATPGAVNDRTSVPVVQQDKEAALQATIVTPMTIKAPAKDAPKAKDSPRAASISEPAANTTPAPAATTPVVTPVAPAPVPAPAPTPVAPAAAAVEVDETVDTHPINIKDAMNRLAHAQHATITNHHGAAATAAAAAPAPVPAPAATTTSTAPPPTPPALAQVPPPPVVVTGMTTTATGPPPSASSADLASTTPVAATPAATTPASTPAATPTDATPTEEGKSKSKEKNKDKSKSKEKAKDKAPDAEPTTAAAATAAVAADSTDATAEGAEKTEGKHKHKHKHKSRSEGATETPAVDGAKPAAAAEPVKPPKPTAADPVKPPKPTGDAGKTTDKPASNGPDARPNGKAIPKTVIPEPEAEPSLADAAGEATPTGSVNENDDEPIDSVRVAHSDSVVMNTSASTPTAACGNFAPKPFSSKCMHCGFKQEDHAAGTPKEDVAFIAAINEFVSTETDFVRDMEMVIREYKEPMGKMLDNAVIEQIFSNIDSIRDLNRQVLARITQRAPTTGGDLAEAYGIIEANKGAYSFYINQWDLSMKALEEYETGKSPVATFLSEQQDKRNGLDLQSFLLKPMQRICRYPLLFHAVLAKMPGSHLDYVLVQQANQASARIAGEVNERKKREEDMLFLNQLQRATDHIPVDVRLVQRERSQILRGECLVYPKKAPKKGERVYFLFSDLLLIVKGKLNATLQPHAYAFKHGLWLNEMSVRDVEDTEAKELPGSPQFVTELTVQDDVLFVAFADSALKNSFVSKLNKAILAAKKAGGEGRKVSEERSWHKRRAVGDPSDLRAMRKASIKDLADMTLIKTHKRENSGPNEVNKDKIVKESWLKREIDGRWVLNYVQLTAVSLQTSGEDRELTGSIAVHEITKCAAAKGDKAKAYVFEVTFGRERYRLMAEEEADRTAWVTAIENAMNQARSEGRVQTPRTDDETEDNQGPPKRRSTSQSIDAVPPDNLVVKGPTERLRAGSDSNPRRRSVTFANDVDVISAGAAEPSASSLAAVLETPTASPATGRANDTSAARPTAAGAANTTPTSTGTPPPQRATRVFEIDENGNPILPARNEVSPAVMAAPSLGVSLDRDSRNSSLDISNIQPNSSQGNRSSDSATGTGVADLLNTTATNLAAASAHLNHAIHVIAGENPGRLKPQGTKLVSLMGKVCEVLSAVSAAAEDSPEDLGTRCAMLAPANTKLRKQCVELGKLLEGGAAKSLSAAVENVARTVELFQSVVQESFDEDNNDREAAVEMARTSLRMVGQYEQLSMHLMNALQPGRPGVVDFTAENPNGGSPSHNASLNVSALSNMSGGNLSGGGHVSGDGTSPRPAVSPRGPVQYARAEGVIYDPDAAPQSNAIAMATVDGKIQHFSVATAYGSLIKVASKLTSMVRDEPCLGGLLPSVRLSGKAEYVKPTTAGGDLATAIQELSSAIKKLAHVAGDPTKVVLTVELLSEKQRRMGMVFIALLNCVVLDSDTRARHRSTARCASDAMLWLTRNAADYARDSRSREVQEEHGMAIGVAGLVLDAFTVEAVNICRMLTQNRRQTVTLPYQTPRDSPRVDYSKDIPLPTRPNPPRSSDPRDAAEQFSHFLDEMVEATGPAGGTTPVAPARASPAAAERSAPPPRIEYDQEDDRALIASVLSPHVTSPPPHSRSPFQQSAPPPATGAAAPATGSPAGAPVPTAVEEMRRLVATQFPNATPTTTTTTTASSPPTTTAAAPASGSSGSASPFTVVQQPSPTTAAMAVPPVLGAPATVPPQYTAITDAQCAVIAGRSTVMTLEALTRLARTLDHVVDSAQVTEPQLRGDCHALSMALRGMVQVTFPDPARRFEKAATALVGAVQQTLHDLDWAFNHALGQPGTAPQMLSIGVNIAASTMALKEAAAQYDGSPMRAARVSLTQHSMVDQCACLGQDLAHASQIVVTWTAKKKSSGGCSVM